MSFARRYAAIAACAMLVAGPSCGDGETTDEPTPAGPCVAEGLIVEIAGDAGTISSFVVADPSGSIEIEIDPRTDYGFNLSHLYEHEEQDLPVRVTCERVDGRAVAREILDA